MTITVGQIAVPMAAVALPRDFEGYVFISDIDKTYLATQIDTLSGLIRAAFETAERKTNIPGFSVILRACRRGAGEQPLKNPLFFVSASPPQMEAKLAAKMELDGVENDGIIFKDQFEHVRTGRFKKLKEQIGFKLSALLALWQRLPKRSKLVLFGDDSESDAVIYSLFTEIVAKNIEGKQLSELLSYLGVFREEALKVGWFSRNLREAAYPVQAAFINLETGSQPGYYSRFGSFIHASENSMQVAVSLFEQGLIREQAVRSVGREMILYYDFNTADLLESLEAGARRGLYALETLDKLWPLLHATGILPPPVPRPAAEGAVTRLNPRRWHEGAAKDRSTLQELKLRYSDEGRY
jgi:hypothetical protein